jgi:hypothetical protein
MFKNEVSVSILLQSVVELLPVHVHSYYLILFVSSVSCKLYVGMRHTFLWGSVCHCSVGTSGLLWLYYGILVQR